MKIVTLLLRSSLKPGESLLSLLARLAAINRYSSPRAVIQICQKLQSRYDNVTRPSTIETYEILSELTKIGVDDLFDASVYRFAAIVKTPSYKKRLNDRQEYLELPSGRKVQLMNFRIRSRHIWLDHELQYCPFCLSESAHHRLIWMPIASTACIDHKCLLVHGCPNCKKNLTISEITTRKCHRCYYNLINAPVVSIANDDIGLISQKIIQTWLMGLELPSDLDGTFGLKDQSRQALYGFVHTLTNIFRQTRFPKNLHKIPSTNVRILPKIRYKADITPVNSYILHTTSFKTLIDWPEGFHRVLDGFRYRNRRQPTGNMREDLSSFYGFWQKFWKHESFQFVRDAFHQYVADGYGRVSRGMFKEISQRQKLGYKFSYSFIHDIAQELNTVPDMVWRLIKSDVVNDQRRKQSDTNDMKLWAFSPAEVRAIKKILQTPISIDQAARLLGTSEDVIVDLMETGLLGATFDEHLNDRQLLCQEVSYVVKTLRHNSTKHPPLYKGTPIHLISVADKIGISGVKLSTILSRVLEREIRSYWLQSEYRLDALRLWPHDIGIFVEWIRTGIALLSHHQAGFMVRVDPKVIEYLTERRILGSVESRKAISYYRRDDIYKFREKYVSLQEVAAISNADANNIKQRVNSGELQPVLNTDMFDWKNYIFPRTEVERLKKNGS